MEKEVHPQILGRPKTILTKIENQSALTVIYTDTEKDTKKFYKCDKIRHIAKDSRLEQKMKNYSIQDKLDNEENDKQKDFGEGPEQAQYKGPIYLMLNKERELNVQTKVKTQNKKKL